MQLGEMANDCDALEAALRRAMAVDRPAVAARPAQPHRLRRRPSAPTTTRRTATRSRPSEVTRTKAVMGIPDEPFWAPADWSSAYREHAAERGAAAHDAVAKRTRAVDARRRPRGMRAGAPPASPGGTTTLPTFEQGEKIATRVAIEKAFNATLDGVPGLVCRRGRPHRQHRHEARRPA